MKQKAGLIFLLALLNSLLFGELIDISGRLLYLDCKGTGSPTVVLVSGRSDRSDIWDKVLPGVAKFTRVCAYDRPGTVTIKGENVAPSRSTSVPQPVTPKEGVADLHALLSAAKVPSPYVLVGHSYGGLIVRLYASTYPDEVAGLVLIDTLTEFLYDTLTEKQQAQWIRLNSNYSPELDRYTIQEKTDFIPSFHQMRHAPSIRRVPAIVLTSDQPYDFKALIASGIIPSDAPLDLGTVIYQAHVAGQKRLANLLNAKHVTKTHAGHYIQTEQPQLVINSILEVVKSL